MINKKQNILVDPLLTFLMAGSFPSKRAMAAALGVNYRTLLNVCAGKASAKVQEKIVLAAIRYCIQHGIPIEQAIRV